MSATTHTPMEQTAPVGPVQKLLSAEGLLTAGDLADCLDLPLWKVYELGREGDLPVVRIRRSMRFDPQRVARWLQDGGTAGNA